MPLAGRIALALAVAGVLAAGYVLTRTPAAAPQPSAPAATLRPASPDAIEAMAQRCIEQMISDTCRAARDTSPPSAAGGADVVFVAGIGMIDGAAYDALRSNGEAMCSAAVGACRRDAASATCRTARQLWGEAASAPAGDPPAR